MRVPAPTAAAPGGRTTEQPGAPVEPVDNGQVPAPAVAATAVAPDGSPVELFALLPAGRAPALVHGALPDGAEVLELGCGAGRLTHPLVALGHPVVAVDQCPDMLAHVRGAATVLADIEDLDLGRRFEAVVLASFLVNTPDPARRQAFLSTCARHLRPGGVAVIQRLDPELVPLAVDAVSEEDGVVASMRDVVHEGDLFTATMGFTVAGRHFEQRYQGLVLDDAGLDRALAAAGLRRVGFLDERRTWVTAAPAGSASSRGAGSRQRGRGGRR